MEMKRNEILKRISELNKVPSKTFTAMELRGNRPMLRRVQRRETMRFDREVAEQKMNLSRQMRGVDQNFFNQRNGNEKIIIEDDIKLPVFPRLIKTRLHRYSR